MYSDLGYLLAGEALSRLVGEPLATAVHDEVTLPLGIDLVTGDELAARGMVDVTAPTEDVPFRGGVVRAQVHDENAWALSRGGLSGHAGLFGRAACVLELGVAILDCIAGARPEFLSPLDVAPLWKRRQGGTLRMGFDGKAAQGSSAGAKFGRSTFGHLGFTGTSLWMDPDAGVVGVLLTNRVHPTRTGDAIRAARPEAYDAIFDWATSSA